MIRTLILVRHGHTESSDAGRYLGRTDMDLSAQGLRQAEHLAAWIANMRVDAILTSPALRARRTAEIVGSRAALAPTVDERLRELDFGLAEGLTLSELRARHAEAAAGFESDPVTNHFPGGEHPAVAVERLHDATEDVLHHPWHRTLLVTHNTLIRLFICEVLGIPLSAYRRRLPIAEHCALTELVADDDGLALRRFNAVVPGNA
jgi:broad specificity phosphatase PhoE